MKVNNQKEKEMEKEKNIIQKADQHLKENIRMDKEMVKEKNII